MARNAARTRVPKAVAVINVDHCTGCEACVEVCPVDCIALIEGDLRVKGAHSWCEIDMERCIGCELCIHLPRRQADPYELTVCPWDAIEMVPAEFLPQAVAHSGGPAEYLQERSDRLMGIAQRVAEERKRQLGMKRSVEADDQR